MFDYFAISNFDCVCSFFRISAFVLIAIDCHFWQVFVQPKKKLFGDSIIDQVDVDFYTISSSALKRGDTTCIIQIQNQVSVKFKRSIWEIGIFIKTVAPLAMP